MSILKRQVSYSSNFSSFFIVIVHNLSVIFSSCIFYSGQKDPIKVPILTLPSVLMKICQIPHAIFQTTSQFFFWNFAWHFSVMIDNSSVLFRSNVICVAQKGPIKVQIIENFEILDQNSLNSCPFWNSKFVFLQILHHCFVQTI